MIGNNNRKTKRNSPPPLSTTTIVEDHQTNHNKFLKDSFSKWSKVLQLISPPNKKRRAFQEQQRLQQKEKDRWSSSSSSSDDSDSNDEESDSDDDATVVNKLYTITKKSISTPTLLRREKGIEDQLNNKQKMLKRRGMYIPHTSNNKIVSNNNDDGPKDAWHQWNLYRRTCQRLRQARLPLLEVIHLRKMLVNLQPTTMMTSTATASLPDIQGRVKEEEEEEEDNVPLGTLMEKNKRSRSPTKHNNASGVFETKRQHIPAPSTMSHAIYTPQHYYNPYKQMLHQSCYYYNNTISTYKPIAATTVKFN